MQRIRQEYWRALEFTSTLLRRISEVEGQQNVRGMQTWSPSDPQDCSWLLPDVHHFLLLSS